MIRMQILERSGANLYDTLVKAMREGDLRTFVVKDRGRRVTHRNPSYHGWLAWSAGEGEIACRVVSPRHPGSEWRLFSAFLGRLADRFADRIVAINVHFPPPRAAKRAKRPKRALRGGRPARGRARRPRGRARRA